MANIDFNKLNINSTPNKRSELEDLWVSFQPYLLSKGYRLRARYQPDWVPSWRPGDSPLRYEDSLDCKPLRVLDATRILDGQQVKIKMVVPSPSGEAQHEYGLLKRFSSMPLKEDASNHVVPLLDSFPIPGVESGYFTVTPLLGRYNHPPFYNLAEIHDFLQQIFEGVLFMHKNDVAHWQKKPRYYLIDLGHTKWFKDSSVPRTSKGIAARIPAPEQSAGNLWDPFAVDVYQLGMLIHEGFMKDIDLEFLTPLVRQMIHEDPGSRPSLAAAHASMNTAFLGLSGWRYRRPVIKKTSGFPTRCQAFLTGLSIELKYLLQRLFHALGLQ
ncbi:unnamed protein product [Rhizoctonia solani]|uniref:Protein kinase domain-containing protein n=1 Tax=Rhizoctonia solani TaxID=456999 RepID=A0A8H3CMM7_9AGAM|nr:unnamed protein product [Rhizoctonia solani]